MKNMSLVGFPSSEYLKMKKSSEMGKNLEPSSEFRSQAINSKALLKFWSGFKRFRSQIRSQQIWTKGAKTARNSKAAKARSSGAKPSGSVKFPVSWGYLKMFFPFRSKVESSEASLFGATQGLPDAKWSGKKGTPESRCSYVWKCSVPLGGTKLSKGSELGLLLQVFLLSFWVVID